MQRIGYIAFYIISQLISRLPYRIMFRFADIIFFILYYILKYRKKVILENLRNSFPDLPEKQIHTIAYKYYRHLGDLFIENISLLHISPKSLKKRCRFKNPEVINQFYRQGRNAIVATSHYGNWELTTGFSLQTEYEFDTIYKPLSNPYFDNFYYKIRSRHGAVPITMKETYRKALRDIKNGSRVLYGMVADQRPLRSESHCTINFLNQETRVFMGIEKMAKKLNLPIVYGNIQKIERGHYEVEFKTISDQSADTEPYEITKTYFKYLENSIRQKPEYWLWSHKRWK